MITRFKLQKALRREIPEEEYPFVARWFHSRDLKSYREYMAGTGHADFMHPHAKHHKVMAAALERIARGELKRLIIQLPPGSAKSTITSIQFATWYWALFPHHHVLRCSATDTLAKKFARRNISAVMTPEWQELAQVSLDKRQQAVDAFANSRGGSMTAAGVGTSIIGLRSNLSILDDPVSGYIQVNSETQRQGMIDWYFAEYRSRLIPGGSEVIVTTRWRADDLVGFILKSEEAETWEVIRIPMLCDSDDDPLGRKIGDRLWPEWFTEQMVREQMRDPEKWAGMYQQTPLSAEGDWLNPENLPLVDGLPPDLGIYAALDIAMSDGKGDFSVCVVAGMNSDGVLYLIDMWRDRVTPDKIIENIVRLHQQYGLREVLIDDDSGTKVFMNLAHKILMQRGEMVPLHPIPTRGQDKEVRAAAFRGLAKMRGVRMLRAPWNVELLREVCEFPFGRRDDIVDTLALLGRRAAQMSASRQQHVKSLPLEFSTIERDGRLYTRETLDDLFESQPRSYGILRI